MQLGKQVRALQKWQLPLFKVRVLPPDTEVTHVSSTLKTKVAAFLKCFYVYVSANLQESLSLKKSL
jgi:hypothetical protein